MDSVRTILVFVCFCCINRGRVASSNNSCSKNICPKVCDYIIVGAGASGATIAARLSELSHITVCLFEAGIKDTAEEVAPLIETPRLWPRLLPGPITYNYTTVPQKGLNGRTLFVGMGKTLGGSTTHNVFVFFRGFKADYDNWAANGAKGWSFDDVFPFFLKLENNLEPMFKDSPYHNQCGPFGVSIDPTFASFPLYKLLKNATKENGIPEVDCNEPSPFGFCILQNSIRNERRESTATAYLRPASGRRNLCIVTEALVEKILISKYQKKAYGIRYSKNGCTYFVKARQEVIVSGGSFGSAQLLQLSGIGPAPLLRKLKIQTIADLPVGYNYHDHPVLLFELLIDLPMSTLEMLNDPKVMAEYVFRRTGRYSGSGDSPLIVVFDTVKENINRPEAVVLFADGRLVPTSTNQRNTSTVFLWFARPKSRGTVQIRNKDPTAPPLIDPKMLQDKQDIKTIIDVIRQIQKFASSPSMKVVKASVVPALVPIPCRKFKTDSDEQWECVLRHQATDNQHPVSTCRMGNPRDKNTVVDTNLRVHGVKGLRVADASIMPEITSANTMAPSIMIGEKAADIIKKDYRDRN